MSANLKLLPQGERLLEGKITADMSDSQLTVTVDNPPLITALPDYLEIDPDSTTYRELCRCINVSGSTITLERGLNNGGTGFQHASNTPFKFKFTSRHWQAVVTALESGYLFEDASYVFTKSDDTTFTITAAGVDRTDTYTVGRKLRFNGTTVVTVVSSSYSSPDTTVIISGDIVPTTITSIELQITTKGNTNPGPELITANKATGATINTGTDDATIVTPKALADSDYLKLGDASAFWTSFAGAYASGTTITVATDMTAIFKKGVSLKWLSSADALKIGKVVSSSYSAPNTTITIVGSTAASGDKSFYYGADVLSETFIVAGNQSTGTNVSKTWTNKTPVYEISVDTIVSTAGITNSTDYDLNIGGSTKITTKPSIASTATTDLDNVVDNVTTEVAVNSLHTIDIDAASTTQAIDGYITLSYIPSWWINRT